MPPKKAATQSSSTSANKKAKAKAPSISVKEKENNVQPAPSTAQAKKPTVKKAAAPVTEGAVRRSARRTAHQEGPTNSLADEVDFVQTAASEHVTSKPVAGAGAPYRNDVTSKGSYVPSKGSSDPPQHPRSQSSVVAARRSDATKSTAAPKKSALPNNSAGPRNSTTPKNTAAPTNSTVLKKPAVPKNSAGPKNSAAPKNSATPKNTAAATKSSSATAKPTNKSVLVPMSSTVGKPRATAIPNRSSALSNNSATDTFTERQTTMEAHSEVPQQFLAEMAALKAKLSHSEAMVDKYKKNASANPVEVKEIPEPRGKYSLQEAMGLKDEKELYNACRATIGSIMINANIPVNTDWRRQDSAVVANIFSLAKQLEPRLAGFERNWAIAAIIRTINKNKRNYRAKLVKKYIPPKRRNGGISETTGTGIGVEEDSHDQDNGNQELAEFSDNIDDANVGDDDDQELAEFSDNNDDANAGDDEEGEEFNEEGAAAQDVDLDEDEAMYASGNEMDAAGTGEEMEELDEEISGGLDGKSDDMEEDEGGIDEEECRNGRKTLKRPLFIDDDSDEKVQRKNRKSRRI